MGTTLAGNTQKTKEFVTEEKLAKNTRNNKVYAQPIQEIQRKLRFFDRSLKPRTIKNGRPGGTLVQGLNLYTIKGLGPRGRFYGLGARKTQKTKKLRKPSQGEVNIFLQKEWNIQFSTQN